MSAKDKAALMRRLREQRQQAGMVQVNVWVRREDVERLRRYVARLNRSAYEGSCSMSENYEFLARLQPNSWMIEMNEHACNYVTATQWIEEYCPEHFSDVAPDLIAGMKATNTIYRLQIYPATPIGFYSFYGPTLDSVVEQARAHFQKSGGR